MAIFKNQHATLGPPVKGPHGGSGPCLVQSTPLVDVQLA